MNRSEFEIGDIVGINKPGYTHVGVIIGRRWFDGDWDMVHNCKFGGVEPTTLAEFSEGLPVFIRQKASGDYFQRENIARRALALVGQKYNLLFFNCEHAASYAQTGVLASPQLSGLALLVVTIGGLFLLAKAAKA